MASCSKCGKELGITSLKFKLRDGSIICRDCYNEAKAKSEQQKDAMKEKLQQQKTEFGISQDKAIFLPDSSDEELEKGILKSLADVSRQEAGSGWAKMGAVLSGNSTDQLIALMLKAIVDENKIIIRQNELLRRQLQRLAEQGEVAAVDQPE